MVIRSSGGDTEKWLSQASQQEYKLVQLLKSNMTLCITTLKVLTSATHTLNWNDTEKISKAQCMDDMPIGEVFH